MQRQDAVSTTTTESMSMDGENEIGDRIPVSPEIPGPDLWLRVADTGARPTDREHRLYLQYVRALALLCECAPYVDEEDYIDLIDELLADACRHYPLEHQRDGVYRAIAARMPATVAELMDARTGESR